MGPPPEGAIPVGSPPAIRLIAIIFSSYSVHFFIETNLSNV
jgi:hypothetical protein